MRPRTNTPLQALGTLNERTFVQAAHGLATRVLRGADDSKVSRLERAFRVVLGRRPQESEQKILDRILEDQLKHFGKNPTAAQALIAQGTASSKGLDPATLAAWTSLANVLLNLDEAITRE